MTEAAGSIYLSVASAWLIWVLIAAATVTPYLFRPTSFARALGLLGERGTAMVVRMRPHMWLGYGIACVIVIHALFAVSAGGFSQLDQTGIRLAAVALVFALGQLAIGMALAQKVCARRALLRRVHFWAMIGLVLTALGHTVLNAPRL